MNGEKEIVTLYWVERGWGNSPAELRSCQAEKRPKTYRIPTRKHGPDCLRIFPIDDPRIHMTPEAALDAWVRKAEWLQAEARKALDSAEADLAAAQSFAVQEREKMLAAMAE